MNNNLLNNALNNQEKTVTQSVQNNVYVQRDIPLVEAIREYRFTKSTTKIQELLADPSINVNALS